MPADERTCETRTTDVPASSSGGWARRLRVILAVMACVFLGLDVLLTISLAVVCFARGPAATESCLRAAIASCLHLPAVFLVPLVVLNALLTAEFAAELLRFGDRRRRLWSDKRHIITVLILWVIFSAGQLPATLIVRRSILHHGAEPHRAESVGITKSDAFDSNSRMGWLSDACDSRQHETPAHSCEAVRWLPATTRHFLNGDSRVVASNHPTRLSDYPGGGRGRRNNGDA
jgi:hypothetical protein